MMNILTLRHRWMAILSAVCVLTACDKTTADFTYSPTEPRAGEAVRFSNSSTDGEEWYWTFGDGSVSESKSPSHTYRRPGTYTVVLQVDKKKSLTKTRSITVYDTVPTFSCSDTMPVVFRDVTFRALVYNPYNYPITYQWEVASNTLYTQLSETNTAAVYKLYFEQAASNVGVRLTLALNGDTTVVEKTFAVQDAAATTVYLRTAEQDYHQRIFPQNRFEMPIEDKGASAILDAVQDTVQEYNGTTFTLNLLRIVIPDIEGFRIANRKLYYRANGLYVSHMDGSDLVEIDPQPTSVLAIDVVNNRLYWAVADSVRSMPLIGSDNNQFTTTPLTLNRLRGVEKIAIGK